MPWSTADLATLSERRVQSVVSQTCVRFGCVSERRLPLLPPLRHRHHLLRPAKPIKFEI